jgi:hypothetical protein
MTVKDWAMVVVDFGLEKKRINKEEDNTKLKYFKSLS